MHENYLRMWIIVRNLCNDTSFTIFLDMCGELCKKKDSRNISTHKSFFFHFEVSKMQYLNISILQTHMLIHTPKYKVCLHRNICKIITYFITTTFLLLPLNSAHKTKSLNLYVSCECCLSWIMSKFKVSY